MDQPEISPKGEFAVVIPVYNHEAAIVNIIKDSLKLNLPIFVVDDGSTDSTYTRIKNMDGIFLLKHSKNQGKGAAILTGFAEAVKIAAWAITIDADGQHNPGDACQMMQAIPENERPLVVGKREGMNKKTTPWTSRFGRKFSNFWVWLSGGPSITDSQSGFRIYPLPEAMNLNVISKRFQFEVEILVKARWNKIPIIETPISVNYAPRTERISHFRPLVDFLRNTATFARLIVQRALRPCYINKQRQLNTRR